MTSDADAGALNVDAVRRHAEWALSTTLPGTYDRWGLPREVTETGFENVYAVTPIGRGIELEPERFFRVRVDVEELSTPDAG